MYQQSNSKYFRVTAYEPKNDICFIMDCYGMFEKLWQFSSLIVNKGCKIIEASKDDQFLDVNIEKLTEVEPDKIILRANGSGQPRYVEQTIDGVTYKALEVEGKIYIPTRNAQ